MTTQWSWVTGTQEVGEAHASEEAGGPEGRPESRKGGERCCRQGSVRERRGARRVTPWPTRARAARSGRTSTRLSLVTLVVERVTNGAGAMPSFKGQLSEKQIADVAAYVSSVAGTSWP